MGVKAFVEGGRERRGGCSSSAEPGGAWGTHACMGQSPLALLHSSSGCVAVGPRISPSLEEPSQALRVVCLTLPQADFLDLFGFFPALYGW